MKTEKRIKRLAETVFEMLNLFDRSVTVADIATDHGYLAEQLNEENRIEKVIATDISEKSLSKLKKLKEERKLGKVEPVVGDGLNPIELVDISIIAGIGGFEISKMLATQNNIDDGKIKCRYFVLQPAQNIEWLREWIYKNHFKVLSDRVVQDGKQFYPIVCVDVLKKEKNKISVENLFLGTNPDINDEDFVSFLKEKFESLMFLNNLPQNRIKKDENLRQKCKLQKIIAKMLKNAK